MSKSHTHFLSLGSALGSILILSQGAIAQEIYTFEPLPTTAPEIPLWEDVPAMEPVFYDPVIPETSPGQEYIFEAPAPRTTTTDLASPRSMPTTTARYRVEVFSNSPVILATVRQVEPTAFVKGDRIQAGLFSERENAETLRANLQASGIAAQITDAGAEDGTTNHSSPSQGGYFVAIPTRGETAEIQAQLQRMGIQGALIEAKTAPRGPHIAIGPFAQREEAELMNVRVKLMDLDGRLYFQN